MERTVGVLLVGAQGRLGEAISRVAELQDGIAIVARCGRGDPFTQSIDRCDVLIDVSSTDAVEEICAVCVEHGKPLVIGTTGHSPKQTAAIETAAAKISIVLAPNFSVGVNTLFWLARKAAELLGDDFDIDIIEAHHRSKKDAPSGTAKRLGELLRDLRPDPPAKEITMHAIRAGDIVGDHTVMFTGPGERLELTHRASSRDPFALGALRAARWTVERPPGLYSMENVLGL